MALLDQKPAGFRIQIVADELEFRLGQTQSIDIVRFAAVGVGKQYLGRNLLHDAVRNVRTQRIRRALRAEDKKGILLAVGLEAVLREGAERIVPQGFPEFVDVDHKPTAVEETVDPVEHVHHERRANRTEEHKSELQSLMRSSYAVFCLKKKNKNKITSTIQRQKNIYIKIRRVKQ